MSVTLLSPYYSLWVSFPVAFSLIFLSHFYLVLMIIFSSIFRFQQDMSIFLSPEITRQEKPSWRKVSPHWNLPSSSLLLLLFSFSPLFCVSKVKHSTIFCTHGQWTSEYWNKFFSNWYYHRLYFADQSVRPETEEDETPLEIKWPLLEGNIEMMELLRETPFDVAPWFVPVWIYVVISWLDN